MNRRTPEASPTRRALSVPEAAESLGLSEAMVYRLCWRKELPSRKVGRRLLIPVTAIDEFLATAAAS